MERKKGLNDLGHSEMADGLSKVNMGIIRRGMISKKSGSRKKNRPSHQNFSRRCKDARKETKKDKSSECTSQNASK